MEQIPSPPPPVVSVHVTARRTPAAQLARLQEVLARHPELAQDAAAATGVLEREVAELLGKEAALLLPTGKMAQQVALRIHADRRPGRPVVLAHPANHLTPHEESNYSVLHGLQVRAVGDRFGLMRTADIEAGAAAGDAATVLWELPQREIGGELPVWDELCDQVEAARRAGMATHLDGARVWQTVVFYERPLAQVCAGFDSVYVSLYKDLEAPHGAVLAGDAALVDAARVWRQRLGGQVEDTWPVALLALDGLHVVTAAMPQHVEHARALAAAITARTGVVVRPTPPQAAMFHLHLPVAADAATRAQEQLVAEGHPRLALRFRTGPDVTRCSAELTVGQAALELPPEQVAETVARLLELAGSGPVGGPGS